MKMPYEIRRIEYFYITVKDKPGEAYEMLNQLAGLGINLLAFAAMPTGSNSARMTLFPEDSKQLQCVAKRSGLVLGGPNCAFLVHGEDDLGVLVEVHKLLYQAKINVYASNGVTNGKDNFCYIIYVRREDYERAAEAMGI
jgi:hypothetical protein